MGARSAPREENQAPRPPPPPSAVWLSRCLARGRAPPSHHVAGREREGRARTRDALFLRGGVWELAVSPTPSPTRLISSTVSPAAHCSPHLHQVHIYISGVVVPTWNSGVTVGPQAVLSPLASRPRHLQGCLRCEEAGAGARRRRSARHA
eukprot:gene8308-biopygen1581